MRPMRPFTAPQLNPATDSGWRRQWFDIIYRHDTRPSRNFDLLLVYAIIASVVVVMFDSVQRFHAAYADWLYVLEWGFTILFTGEYLLRLVVVKRPLRYAFSIWGIIDLASILPTYLSLFIPGAQSLLVVRALRILQQALGLVAFGDILGDLDETEQAAVFADRFDHLAGAEPLAVAAHPPAFTDEAAMVPRVRQRLLRDAQLLVFGGVEQADVLADDGLGGIALDPFAATVPAADTALRIEQIDRVIAHVVDQQLQLPAFVGERCNAGYGLDHDGYRLPR